MKTRAILIAVLLASSNGAWADHALQLTRDVVQLEPVAGQSGDRALPMADSSRVEPGDLLQYRIGFVNDSDELLAPGTVVITSPMPSEAVYVEDSAAGIDAEVSFSPDGGETWAAAGPASDYTHVRWVLQRPIEAQARGSVGFRARLR